MARFIFCMGWHGPCATLIALGALVWIIARDVVRYRPLVIALIVIQLIGAPVLCLIDVTSGMPRWWCIMDFTSCLLGGGILLPLIFKKSPLQATAAAPASGN
jgi:hypothetical protein